MTSLSSILGKWTKLGNNITTCRIDTKIWSILKVGNRKTESLFQHFQNFNASIVQLMVNLYGKRAVICTDSRLAKKSEI